MMVHTDPSVLVAHRAPLRLTPDGVAETGARRGPSFVGGIFTPDSIERNIRREFGLDRPVIMRVPGQPRRLAARTRRARLRAARYISPGR